MIRIFFTLILLLLNVGWITGFIYLKTHTVSKEEKIEMKIQADFMSLQAIQIQFHSDNTTIHIIKEEDVWKLKEPIAWEANPLALSHFLQHLVLTAPQFSFKDNSETDLNNYGLSNPFCTIKCTTPEHTHILNLGNASQDNHKIYILESETNEIFVIDAAFLKTLTLPLEQWCDTMLSHFHSLKSIAFETEKQKVFLNNIQDVWHMKTPLNEALDQQHAKVVCQQLMHLELMRFLTPPETQKVMESFISDTGLYHLTLMDENAAVTFKILPFNPAKHLYIAQRNDTGPLFFLQTTVFERLMFAQETLRERTLFHLDVNALHKIVYKKGEDQVVLQAIKPQQWEVVTYQKERFIQANKAQLPAIKDLVHQLNELYIEQFLDEPPQSDVLNEISFKIEGNEVNDEIHFYKGTDGYFVQMGSNAHYFKLTGIDAHLLELKAEDFQDKTVWQWGPREYPVQILLSSTQDPTWKEIHLGTLDKHRLGHLEAQQWVTHNLRFPLAQPIVYTLKISTQTPEGISHTYLLNFEDRLYGTVQSGQYLSQKFTFTQPWIDLLFKMTHQKDWDVWSSYIQMK